MLRILVPMHAAHVNSQLVCIAGSTAHPEKENIFKKLMQRSWKM
jgi:hypothetical protein